MEKIVRSRYQPLLLIYANPAAVPVTTDTAPNTRVMAPGYSLTPGKGKSLITVLMYESNHGLQTHVVKPKSKNVGSKRKTIIQMIFVDKIL